MVTNIYVWQTFRHGKHLDVEQHWSVVAFWYLNMEASIHTTTSNQHLGMVNI